jgi:hypothetical protein
MLPRDLGTKTDGRALLVVSAIAPLVFWPLAALTIFSATAWRPSVRRLRKAKGWYDETWH